MTTFHAIIPAAGIGARTQTDIPKQHLKLPNGKTLLQQCAELLSGFVEHCVIAHHNDDKLITSTPLPQNCNLVTGGNCRAKSVFNALQWLVQKGFENDWVLVHDAARPFIEHQPVKQLIDHVVTTQRGAILATPVVDTIKQSNADKHIQRTLNRDELWQAQTPQVFPIKHLYAALSHAELEKISDEASAMELAGHEVDLIEGTANNIKITYPKDITMNQLQTNPLSIRIGSGFDVHAFTEGSGFVLGGVSIPYHRAIKAHSDGDVLLHALCDAILGALALGDIGQHFPDTDVKWHNANSRELLKAVNKMIQKKGYTVGNIDITIMAQAPKLLPYKQAMINNIANDLGVDVSHVSVKATTTEKLGFIGREEGIGVQAQVLLH